MKTDTHLSVTVLAWIGGLIAAVAPAARAQTTRPAEVPQNNPCVQTISFAVPGKSGDARSHAVVILPRAYVEEPATGPAARRWPVLYLLHGYGATHTRYWIKFAEVDKPLDAFADRFGLILVTPDGNRCSWYLDAPDDVPGAENWQYETIITKCLVPEIDRRYRTWAEPAGRGLTGNSMGGHGALYLAARHPKLFSACSSIAGVLSLTDVLNPADLTKRLGPLENHRDRWVEHSVLTQADRFAGESTAIFFDCGREDPFIVNNRALHMKLLGLGVEHAYLERPGGHTAEYWETSLAYHLQFMADHLKPAGVTAATGHRRR